MLLLVCHKVSSSQSLVSHYEWPPIFEIFRWDDISAFSIAMPREQDVIGETKANFNVSPEFRSDNSEQVWKVEKEITHSRLDAFSYFRRL